MQFSDLNYLLLGYDLEQKINYWKQKAKSAEQQMNHKAKKGMV